MNTVPYHFFDGPLRVTTVAAVLKRKAKLHMERKPARDAAIIAAERVYKSSNQYQLDKLLKKSTLYRRRLTIALEALDQNQREIQKLLLQIAGERMSEPRKEDK